MAGGISGRVGVVAWLQCSSSHRQLLFVWTSAQIMAEISSQHELADNGNYQIASALGAGSCRAGVKGLSSWQYLDQLDFYGIIEMCYFHTSSTISFKLKCDISRFTHCIHEEMRSGCACICKSCVKTRIICWWSWRCAGMAGGWRPGAPGPASSPTSWPSLITALPSSAQPSSRTPFLFNSRWRDF